ncbi:hypothetical protein [Microbulbifer sp. A4B17]|uniref:hypothetical protein n=1 Tax=Microbulbifer sp. A4B17 TaxID=359370 RepID=UPI001EDEFC4E|nr:hypothetical protein [Microbulbifer sp. A4B17]
MKTFKQAFEVIKDAERFHLEMANVYENLLEKSEDYRTQLLLKHMLEHEQRMAKNLQHYNEVAQNKVMKTWLQYTHEESTNDFIRRLNLSDPPTIREINNMAGR